MKKERREPSLEEKRLYLNLGYRLQVFQTAIINSHNGGTETLYKNINAVTTVAFFVTAICKEENKADKEAFLSEMETLSEEQIKERVIEKTLDYFEKYAKDRDNKFLIALASSNKERFQSIRGSKVIWNGLKAYPTIPATVIDWDFNILGLAHKDI